MGFFVCFFSKCFLCYKCYYTWFVLLDPASLCTVCGTLISSALTFTGCDIPCSRRQHKWCWRSSDHSPVAVCRWRVHKESAMNLKRQEYRALKCIVLLAQLIRITCYLAAVELPKGCLGLQFLFLRSQPKSQKPLWVAKGKREKLETPLF